MTSMVDPGFLLITFFVITTELSKPVTTDLIMLKEGPDLPLCKSDALTVCWGIILFIIIMALGKSLKRPTSHFKQTFLQSMGWEK
jgi:hypothetical protein